MLVVTDVDNTLYDWVAVWAGAFSALLRTLEEKTGRPRVDWVKAAHAVHVRRQATECGSLLSDLVSSPTWPFDADPRAVLPEAATAYRQHWDRHLHAFPGVREALAELAGQGHAIVAYTEGDVAIAATRLTRLGLAGVIRRVFGRPSLPLAPEPAWCMLGTQRHCPIAVDFIPRDDSKPNPAGLRTIVARCGASIHQAVYIGDNLWKDVVMAKRLGVSSIWARYGTARNPADMALLEQVAHWNPRATAVERQATAESVSPDVVVDHARELVAAIHRRTVAAV
jgi:phosphoglycolate phosphatase